MKGQSKPCWTPFPISTIIRFEDGCRTMDVGSYLRTLGLEQYEALFHENDIDAEVLGDLTDADLEKLGVTLGHRKRLLKAIAGLGATEPAAKPTRPPPLSSSTDAAERRPITVMFCDLAGSTGLAAKFDAEDWRNLVNAYLDQASAAVTDFGGHVLKKLGDGLMALFGYPKAQESDAERAVRAALAIQRGLVELNERNAARGAPELTARIGLESGLVVVDATGEVFGDAPNIAARVQAAAEPGSVLVTARVQRHVAGLFVVEEKGTHELKGVAQPLSLYRVVRASGGGRRGGARTLTPLVGREEALDQLSRCWERTRKGEGQLALVIGEPGIGKSRLIEEFHARLAETPHTWVEWSASQLFQNTPLHPIAEWGRLRFRVDAPAEDRLADLEGTLRLIGLDPTEHALLLAPLVDIPLPPPRAANFPPEELRRRQLAAMTAWVLAGARSQPVVLAFEDLQWADPTSLDLLRALADRGAQVPMLLLATTRPEFRPDWSVRSHHSLIFLSPLDRAQVVRMVSEIAARHALSNELIEGVDERTGGVPLFVEEVTRLVLERGEQGGVQAIPPTLQQSLAARLDRLGAARETAQIGAVLGRDFTYLLLRDVAEVDEPTLLASLEQLAEADLLFVEGAPPVAKYRFKHALIQDAAYDSLLRSRRQALHRYAAELLRDNPDHSNAEPEVIARHFTQAGLEDLAIEWWSKAGDQALRRSAFKEAISHLGKAIEMVDRTEVAGSRRATCDDAASNQRVKLQSDYGRAVMWSKGYAAAETETAFARASELAARTENSPERYAAAYGQWMGRVGRGDLRAARGIAESLLRDAQAEVRPMETCVARRALGQTCFFLGEFVEARSQLERTIADHDPERDREAQLRFGLDTGVTASSFLAVAIWALGDAERAGRLIAEAIGRAIEIGHVPTAALANGYKMSLDVFRGDAVALARSAEALVRLSQQHGLGLYRSIGEILLGWARGRLDDPEAGASVVRQWLATYVGPGNTLNVPMFRGLLAELESECGDVDAALAQIDEGLALAQQTGERITDSWLHRLRGGVLLKHHPGDARSAEEAFRTAIAIAQQQSARSLELEAALALAKLYQSTAGAAEARAVLAPALEGFSPTPEMPRIAEAQALLAAIEAGVHVRHE